MRKLIIACIIAAPMLALGNTAASAWGYGYGYRGCGCGYAPRAYGYTYYRPAYRRLYRGCLRRLLSTALRLRRLLSSASMGLAWRLGWAWLGWARVAALVAAS